MAADSLPPIVDNHTLQVLDATFRGLSKDTFEAELTKNTIRLVENYVDMLNGDGSQITRAIRNCLASDKPNPISYAYHIHELFEAEIFAARGFDFGGRCRREDEERLKRAFWADPSVHLGATLKHCAYLHSVATSRDLAVPISNLLELDFMSRTEHQDVIIRNLGLKLDPHHEPAAAAFLGDLFADSPQFFGLVFESIAPNSRLVTRYGSTINERIQQSST